MKVNFKPVGDLVGTGTVYRVRSQSNPFVWHFVVKLEETCETCQGGGTVYENHGMGMYEPLGCPDCEATGNAMKAECSCTGWQMHNKCWHTEEVWEWDEARNQSEQSAEVSTLPEEGTLEQD